MSETGFVNIIKPTGMTSSDVVIKIKKILNQKKVGHLGTLDPAASGVLPVAVGKATKFFDYFLEKDKIYIARVHFGVETDTLDSFGLMVSKDEKVVSRQDIEKVLPKFLGKIFQTPPKYSAIKIGGKRAYELIRQNVEFELKKREIEIFSLEILESTQENIFLFKVHCSAGTYIRTLFSDIAKELGTISTTEAIIRTKSGSFSISNAVTLEEFEKKPDAILIEDVLSDLKIIETDEEIAKKLINGVKINSAEICRNNAIFENEDFFVKSKNNLIGLYRATNSEVVPIVYLYENGKN